MPTIISEGSSLSSYGDASSDLSHLRLGPMFGILFISLFAVSFPGVSKQVPFLKIPHLMFFVGKHFGTGAILATAFCHLLPDAFDALKDRNVNERYHGIGKWVGVIILGSLLSIFLVEYVSTSYVDQLHAKPSAPPSPSSSRTPSRPKTPPINIIPPTPQATASSGTPYFTSPPQSPESSSQSINQCSCPLPATERTPLIRAPKRTKSLSSVDIHRDDAMLSLILLNSPRLSRGCLSHSGAILGRDVVCACHLGRVTLSPPTEGSNSIFKDDDEDEREVVKPMIGRKRQVVGILVLQLGIMIHSLVIGLTLAVTSGSDFTSLVTAIIFHQLFEGLSLGIRIASLPPAHPPTHETPHPSRSPSLLGTSPEESSQRHRHSKSWSQHWLSPTLSTLFAITTPFGMVLGALVFTPSKALTSPAESARMHLTQGLMSAISAGMLIYAATVEMLAGDFVFGDVSGDHGHGHGHGHGHEPNHEHEHEHDKSPLGANGLKILAVCSLLSGSTAMALVGMGE
ncbi:ZIP zinc transporter-domain-containing protein [Lyophyllum atratum]|nr:ZIP zinc transporter-domain-containing protein [Lyophyllum atratum]